MSDKDTASVVEVDTLKDWTPTKDQLRLAANSEARDNGQRKSTSPAVEQEPLQQKDVAKISSTLSGSPPALTSAVASPSPTPTPTPSVVVNGEILKPYPSADVQSTEPTDEVPPLQIQPKRPKDGFAAGMGIGFDLGNNNGYDVSHTERSGSVKQEPYQPEQPTRIHTAPPPAIRQDLGRAQRSSTASPSPSVSEMSAGTGAHRSRTIVDVKSAPTSANSFAPSPSSSTHVQRELISGSRPDRPATAGVYNHRKIPVKNAASHSVTSGHSIMGDKRSIVIDSPPAKDRGEAEVIVPDSQEVPDSQSEGGNDAVLEPEIPERAEPPAKSTTEKPTAEVSPRKVTRATIKAETRQSSAAGETPESPEARDSDAESNRSELTTPPASPALSALPSSAERRIKVEKDDDADVSMRSPPPSSSANEQRKPTGERQMTRRSVKEETNQGAGQRGKKRGRESEGAAPSTPAKRPYRKTGNTQSQDELSPPPPDYSAPQSKAGDIDAERDEDIAEAPRRVMTRRTSTRGKPPTIEEDSEVDDGESERNVRKRSHKDMEQASTKSA